MSDEQRVRYNVALAQAYVSEAERMVMRPLACWDRLTPEQRTQYLDACLSNLNRASRRRTATAA